MCWRCLDALQLSLELSHGMAAAMGPFLPLFVEFLEERNRQCGGDTVQEPGPERILVLPLGGGEVRGAEGGTKARTSLPDDLIAFYHSLGDHGVDPLVGELHIAQDFVSHNVCR